MPDGVSVDLRVCLLSGGDSRRMGRDKALIPHPSGGVWLTALIDQILPLGLPVQVLSRHGAHAELLIGRSDVAVLREPAPWHGPLQALARVLPSSSTEALLVLPVDMPRLKTPVLRLLIAAWRQQPERMAVAHDGQRLQPLLAIIPGGDPFVTALAQQLAAEQWSWLHWLERVPHQPVQLPAAALLNANRPEDLAALVE